MKDLANQIIVIVFTAEWELGLVISFCKRKGDALERRNNRRLKLTDQILKIVERVIKVIHEMQFGFLLRCQTSNTICTLHF